MNQVSYLVIDWGTTNFRAFALSASHKVIDIKELNLGFLSVENGKFAETLQEMLADWLPEYQHLPIYMAGMVGSKKGWVNVPYAATQVNPAQLVESAHKFQLPWGPQAVIMPGVKHQLPNDRFDVMRGEEVQLFGLNNLINQSEFTAILPGTHSKHALMRNNKIIQFSSILTGEIFSVLSKHLFLAKDVVSDIEFDQQAFLKGVAESKGAKLTNSIFLTWTHRLFDQLNEQQVPDYLSGMLIGYELQDLQAKQVYLVGGDKLTHRYQLACHHFGIESIPMSGNDCFLEGMNILIQELNHDR
ncbi:2-dehydro-3-deoxygalactonokinase [Thalassotalea sp. PLHSN55]|uniref:2-dehydro-3-deoxygalactonokinase n=1 Tax=Thalassotalea sp. PLHSN55 TaxID=3435888 RepID=UPI003F8576E0